MNLSLSPVPDADRKIVVPHKDQTKQYSNEELEGLVDDDESDYESDVNSDGMCH